ncbi:hypothetical protein DL240_19230 [Lujinxingia litoralis]|uniref:Uncharacterized protein n=1 Tax=Lujinxingia litoralis TaxID=2211119 RepID=A0A328C251_9DELT|nr:hypothetical protein [Lujinxingia litoralis]RAL19985.1 hypothetical protein DL240_19230 [Lujinxingia litoralis]
MQSTLRPPLAGRLTTLVCLTTLLSACGASNANQRNTGEMAALDLPDAQKVHELASAPAPELDLSELAGPEPAERWELVAPLPNYFGHQPRQQTESWERSFVEQVDALNDTHRSEASACVARQNAHYVRHTRRLPDRELRGFINARCGWVGENHVIEAFFFEGTVPLDQVAEMEAQKSETFFKKARNANRGPLDVGLFIGPVDGQVVVTRVAAPRNITLAPRPMSAGARGTLEGRVHDTDAYEFVHAAVTDGDLQARNCERDPAVRFPAFRFHCGGTAHDEQGRTFFEFALSRRDSPWADHGYLGLFASDLNNLSYTSTAARIPAADDATDEFDRLSRQLNDIRTSASMDPVQIARRQSGTLNRLFPHLLDATRRNDNAAAELYIGAIIAGWDIDEPILSGDLLMRHSAHADASKTMASLMISPMARLVLFDERLSHLALASVRGMNATSLAIGGYNRVPQLSGQEVVERALHTINSARQAAGNRPIFDSENYQQAATLLSQAIIDGKTTPQQASERVVKAMVNNLDSSVRYWTLTTDDLDAFPIPEDIVTARLLRATVIAAPYQHPDDAWSIYRVIIMYATNEIR